MAGLPLSELDQPLGQAKRARAQKPYGRWLWRGLSGGLVVLFAGLGLYAALKRDPDGGEPIATAMIRERPAAPDIAKAMPQPAAPEDRRGPASASQLETDSGVTVVRPGSEAPGAIVITVPDDGTVKLAPAPDKRLVERTRHGFLPKIGPDGATPAQVYARPLGPAPSAKPAGRIAILVGGLGISQSSTSEAIARLPGPVSLAFAPYGAELEKTVQRARGEGHEVFLQVPMEPFDYPDNDPGPQTLLTTLSAEQNADRLAWHMSRFQGYVGIANFMGGRFVATEAAMQPLVKEAARRGLAWLDDGTAPRSIAGVIAEGQAMPFARADVSIDTVPTPAEIDRALGKLENLAKERGTAVGVASALPISIERIAGWARQLEARGIVLVPLTTAMLKPKSS